MKSILSVLMAVFFISGTPKLFAQSVKTETFKVYGNCNMCKKRIEKAATGAGVTKTTWDVNTKIMTITYDSAKTSSDAIQKRIAAVGHDTEKQKAAGDVYNKLPGCCKYERTNADMKKEHANHQHSN